MTNDSSKIVRTCLEIYEVDGKELRRVQELTLLKNEDGDNFVTKRGHNDSRYLLKGSMACNGAVLIWHSSHRWHMFDVVTGIRFKKEHLNSTGLISTYCAKDNAYFHMDAACYSWLKKWKVTGFEPRVIGTKVKKMIELPVVLDSLKGQITAKIEANKEEKKSEEGPGDSTMTNLFDQLLKDSDAEDCTALVKQPEEVKGEPIDGIHEATLSIILAKMSTEAQTAIFKLGQLGDKKLAGEEMLAFIKRKFSVVCSKDFISILRSALSTQIEKVVEGRVTTMVQKNLLDLILVFRANIECLVACRIELKDLLSEDEQRAIKMMQKKIDEIHLFDGQDRKD